jgi:hypothetical protein
MTNPNAEDKILALRRELATQRRECLALPADKALARILDHPQPAALVHSFPEEDFFFLLQDIGPDDAQPLIALGSHRQLEYTLDQQIWNRDRIDLKTLFIWLERFVAAEPARMVRWLAAEKSNLVTFYLFKSIEVRMCAHDQDPTDFGPDFISFDSVFYVRTLDFPAEEPLGETFQKQHRRLVHRILERLADDDHVHYQSMLLAAMNVLPAETEEEAYRLRNVRLAEKGFLPFEDAVGLYQPLSFDRFHQTAARFQRLPATGDTRLPMVPLAMLTSGHLFSQALRTFAPGEALDQIQSEFASLCNCITVADRMQVEDRDDLRAVVDKACGYLDIGLERLDPETTSAPKAARSLQSFTLEGLFRLGYSEAVRLKQAAENWVAESWFAQNGLPLTFWGETWLGVVGGLLLKRPLFFDNRPQGHRYREFTSLADIRATGRQLARVQDFDRLLAQMRIALSSPRGYGHLTYKCALLTLWARSALGLGDKLQPMAVEDFAPFWDSLFGKAPLGETIGRKVGRDRQGDLVQWLARRTGRDADELQVTFGPSLAALFDELAEDYGRVPSANLDPRYMAHFLLARNESGAMPE